MKIHTNDFKSEIKNFGRAIDSKITFGTTELGGEQLNSITPHYESSLLKSVMKQLDIDSNVEIPLETVINYQFGVKVGNQYEYLNYGNYVVYKAEKQEDTKSWKITCYDKMLYAMKDYESLNVTYPISVKNFLVALCTKIGLTLANDDFVNADKMINSELYLDSDGNSLGYTFRDVLDELSQVVAGTICINEDDELEIRYPSNAGEYETQEGTNIHVDNVDDCKDIEFDLEGNTLQDGTPSPDSPIEVQTVSGRQEIDVLGKNLFNVDGDVTTGTRVKYGDYGLTFTKDTNRICRINLPCIMPSGTYTLSMTKVGSNLTNDNKFGFGIQLNGTNVVNVYPLVNGTFIANDSFNQVYIFINNDQADTATITIDNIQLEKGETATSFESCKYENNEINLGKNLFDGEIELGGISPTDGSLITNNYRTRSKNYIKVKPNTTYTLTRQTGQYRWVIGYTKDKVGIIDGVDNYPSAVAQIGSNTSMSFTTTPTTEYIKWYDTNNTNLREQVQIEEGNQATTYSPYKEPIELCKIGDYQDKIYKDGSKWYLHKEIGKVILDGSEANWNTDSSGNLCGIIIDNIKRNTNANVNAKGFCNYYATGSLNSARTDTNQYCIYSGTISTRIFLNNNGMSLADFKIWLSTHNTIVYYLLGTPTTTEITDTELISQLNGIELLEGINNIMVNSPNLSSPLSITYLKELETIDEQYLKDVNVNFGEKFGPVNSIVISRSAESDNIYRKDDDSIEENGLTEIKIKDNQILNGNNRDEFIDGIFNKLNGLEYFINDFKSTGITYLDLLDIYKVKIEDNYYKCIMFNDEVDITQGLEEQVYTEIPEQTETDYKNASKTDRTINQAYIIVKKNEAEIEELASKVVDVSDTTSGIGNITLNNAYKGILHRLEISGSISSLMPSMSLTPKSNLIPIGIYVIVDEERYLLDIDYLNYTNVEEHDTFVYEDGKCWIERINGTIEEREDITIYVDKNSEISIEPFIDAHLFCEYLLDNKYTSTFANQVEVSSELNLLADTLEAKVSQVADEDGNVTSASIILAVNNDTSQAQIEAGKISLQGKEINLTSEDINITSNNFNVDKYGTITCNNANINNGIIRAVADNNDIVTIGGMNGITIEDGDVLPFGINQYSKIDGDGIFLYRDDNGFPKASYSTDEMYFQPYPNDLSIKMTASTGNITCVSLTQTSKVEEKKNFEKLENALDIIKNTEIYEYHLKHQNDDEKKHIGFIIGDDFNYSEKITSPNNNGVDVYSFVSVCCKAIQELQQEIEELRKEIK